MADTNDSPELRFDAPRRVVDVIDALSIARRIKRNELLIEILEQWYEDRMREVTAVMRVTMSGKGGER